VAAIIPGDTPYPGEAIAPTTIAGEVGWAASPNWPIVRTEVMMGGGSWIGRTPRLPERLRRRKSREAGGEFGCRSVEAPGAEVGVIRLVVAGSSTELDATLLLLSVRSRGGTRIGGGLFPPEGLRRAGWWSAFLLERRTNACGWNFERVLGEGGPRTEDEMEEREDALESGGREVAGNGYSKSGPDENGVPTNIVDGE